MYALSNLSASDVLALDAAMDVACDCDGPQDEQYPGLFAVAQKVREFAKGVRSSHRDTAPVWTAHTFVCRGCKQRCRASRGAIDAHREHPGMTDAEVVATFDFCLYEITGVYHDGEYVALCDGAQDEHGNAICDGGPDGLGDIRLVFARKEGVEFYANWCAECRATAPEDGVEILDVRGVWSVSRPTIPVRNDLDASAPPVSMHRFPEFGAFFTIEKGTLLCAPMLTDGTAEPSICEVTNPEGDKFLETINAYFGTSYTEKDFEGR